MQSRKRWYITEVIKLPLIHLLRIFVRIFYIFPIRKNRIVFHSHKGRQYSCNPRAISRYLLHYYGNRLEIIWLFRSPEQYKTLERQGIRVIPYISLRRVFFEATARISINNTGSFNWIPVRKEQMHINTRHGGGCYKRIEKKFYLKNITRTTRKLTSDQTTGVISSSKWFSENVVREELAFGGNILEVGMPRNDIFFNVKKMNIMNRKVRKFLQIKENETIVLYAPTWRFDQDVPHPDFLLLKKAVQLLWGKEVAVVSRSHHYSHEIIDKTIDANGYPDMQDLLCAADILISDYSSVIWDFSFTYRPCFLYAPDLKEYEESNGFDRDIFSWGFPVCRTDEELFDAIVNYDAGEHKRNMEKHHEELGSFEDGHATEKVCKMIMDFIDEK